MEQGSMKGYVCIIGGANIDIQGFPSGAFNMRDSNPGRVRTSIGGVGRNIGENIARLGIEARLLSVVGDDDGGRRIIEESKASGLITDDVLTVHGQHTSTYLSILDGDGDMVCAVSDMEIFEHMGIEYIDSKRNIIDGACLCIIDTNIPGEVIKHVVTGFKNTVFFLDTVSVSKAARARDIIGYFHTIKPNIMEAEALWGSPIKSRDDLKAAGEYFIKQGVERVFISMGQNGVYYRDGNGDGILSSPRVKPINATGAGDAFVAGLAYSWANGFDISYSARFSMAASILALSHTDTINPGMNKENVERAMMEVGIC